MQTNLADFIRHTPEGREAEAILRKCVHCGFCTATCPTYQLLGDELDGPRGRIYLVKQMLEGGSYTVKTRTHLDRCLTCRACESTCPSGVEYHRLIDIGRALAEERLPRSAGQRLLRFVLREFLPRRGLFTPAMRLGQLFRPLLPAALKAKVTVRVKSAPVTRRHHARRMLMLAGCVQPAMAPNINDAAARVLDRLGIALVEVDGAGCCGAVRYHLHDQAGALDEARRNIDAWWPHLEAGAEAVVITASGCGAHVREYGYLLQHDAAYAAKAARISLLTRDIAEAVMQEKHALLELLRKSAAATRRKIAFHAPCSLQHGMQVRGAVEEILLAAGCELTPVADAHLCCGSAGTYSILQSEISLKLRANKLAALHAGAPAAIASANIGCIAHLQEGTPTPVSHWIELLDGRLGA
jgi:glycolate oxidase iron-sulfur subunit